MWTLHPLRAPRGLAAHGDAATWRGGMQTWAQAHIHPCLLPPLSTPRGLSAHRDDSSQARENEGKDQGLRELLPGLEAPTQTGSEHWKVLRTDFRIRSCGIRPHPYNKLLDNVDLHGWIVWVKVQQLHVFINHLPSCSLSQTLGTKSHCLNCLALNLLTLSAEQILRDVRREKEIRFLPTPDFHEIFFYSCKHLLGRECDLRISASECDCFSTPN